MQDKQNTDTETGKAPTPVETPTKGSTKLKKLRKPRKTKSAIEEIKSAITEVTEVTDIPDISKEFNSFNDFKKSDEYKQMLDDHKLQVDGIGNEVNRGPSYKPEYESDNNLDLHRRGENYDPKLFEDEYEYGDNISDTDLDKVDILDDKIPLESIPISRLPGFEPGSRRDPNDPSEVKSARIQLSRMRKAAKRR